MWLNPDNSFLGRCNALKPYKRQVQKGWLLYAIYPQRRNLLATIESNVFHEGEVHRNVGLERVAIFMAKELKKLR